MITNKKVNGIIRKVIKETIKSKNWFPSLLYHGSPYKFNKFSLSKINTGQHSQDFGKGLYFTTDKESAKFYADELSNTETLMDKYNSCVHSYNDTNGILTQYINNDYTVSVKRLVNKFINDGIGNREEWFNFLKEIESVKRYAYIYTVKIDNPNYISREEYLRIQRENNFSDDEMNAFLLSKGYNGIIYDMNTRKLSKKDFSGEKNVVIIDDSIINIITCEKVNFDYIMKIKI